MTMVFVGRNAVSLNAVFLFVICPTLQSPAVGWLREFRSPEACGLGPSSLHSVHFDANFKLNLISQKGYLPDYEQLERRRYFLSNKSVQAALADGNAAQRIGVTHCSNFSADKVGSDTDTHSACRISDFSPSYRSLLPSPRRFVARCFRLIRVVWHLTIQRLQNLVTAVGVAVCRHGMILRLLNLFTGERHAYSTAAVMSIFLAQTAILFWWYDIACRCVCHCLPCWGYH
jgi:hypothetical protein